jgi:hypothetical protein
MRHRYFLGMVRARLIRNVPGKCGGKSVQDSEKAAAIRNLRRTCDFAIDTPTI